MTTYTVTVNDSVTGWPLVDAREMTEHEAREILWIFVRKATQRMDDAHTFSTFQVHAHRAES